MSVVFVKIYYCTVLPFLWWCNTIKCQCNEVRWKWGMYCDIALSYFWPSDNRSEGRASAFRPWLTEYNLGKWNCRYGGQHYWILHILRQCEGINTWKSSTFEMKIIAQVTHTTRGIQAKWITFSWPLHHHHWNYLVLIKYFTLEWSYSYYRVAVVITAYHK